MSDLNHCQLINSRIQELNLSRREIVDRMGYENINKGYRVLDEVRKGELIRGSQIELFATALKLENESLIKAMKNTEEEIRDFKYEIRKKNFKPFLCSIGKNKWPSPIFAAILSNNRRYVFYDDEFLEQEEGKMLEKLKKDVVIHYNKTKGDITPFGKTTHYIFQGYFDIPKDDVLVFDSVGNQITENLEDYRRGPGGGKLRVGGGLLSAY